MDAQTKANPKRVALLTGSSIILAVCCLIGLGSPDGNKLEHDFRDNLKPGTQMKDVIAYIKVHGWTYTWDKSIKSVTTNVPGAKWLPVIKPQYKKVFYFDQFNRLKGQNGNLEYALN